MMVWANIESVDVFQELSILDYAQVMIQDTDARIQVSMASILTDFVLRSVDCFTSILADEDLFTD